MSTDTTTEVEEKWSCGECGHTEMAPAGEVTGVLITKAGRAGRTEREIETPICPECGSEDWYSQSVRDAILGGK